jgi:hypothetical protein
MTKLTQQSNKSPNRRNNGLSEDSSASQGRAGLWKGNEEEELKRLVGIHTGPKGIISWIKVLEAWSSQNLPKRSKASLSSKWRDIKSRPTLLNPTNDQDETSVLILSTSPGIILPDNSNTTTTNTTQEMKKPDEVQPAVIPQAPIPIDINNRLKTNEWSTRTKTIFVKNLKKSQKLGCDVFRKPPKRIICKRFQPIIKEVDDLMKEEIDRKAKGQLTWNQLSILVYAGAMTVGMLVGRSSEEKQSRSKLWFKSTYREVDNLRKTIGKVTAEL